MSNSKTWILAVLWKDAHIPGVNKTCFKKNWKLENNLYVILKFEQFMTRRHWGEFKNHVSINSQKENDRGSKYYWGTHWKYRNYRMKSIVWMTQEISKMLNQYAADHYLTFPVHRRHFLFLLIQEIAQPDVWEYAWYIGKRFCEFACLLSSTLLEHTQFMRWYSCGKKSYARKYGDTRSCSEYLRQRRNSYTEIPTKFVSQKFVLPDEGKKFQELRVRPTKTSKLGTSFWQIRHSTNVFVLENKIQDRSLFLLKFPYVSNAMDQRSGAGKFGGWF